MRLVLAIVSFVAAAVMLAFGIGIRTAPMPPSNSAYAAETTGAAPLTFVDGATLTALQGRQTLEIEGDGPVIAAYGRTADVKAWIGQASYNAVAFADADDEPCVPVPEDEQDDCALTVERVAGAESAVPSPMGSDLWLEDYQDVDRLRLSVTVPSDVSFLVASDGVAPAPSQLELSWPRSAPVPRDYAAWLVIGGAALGVIGLVLLLSAIHGIRSNHGPKRRMPKVPKRPTIKSVRPRPKPATVSERGTAERVVSVVAALAVVGALLSVVPSAPQAVAATTPSPTPTADPEPVAPVPAVTQRQIDRIVERVTSTIENADAAADAALVATRVTWPALQLKQADYFLRSKDGAETGSSPVIPSDGVLALSLPQQVPVGVDWSPRTLFVVIASPQALDTSAPAPTPTDPAAAPEPVTPPVAMLLTQEHPRDNYKVAYLVALEADVPEVPATSVGTAVAAPASPLLALPPYQANPAYADILVNDTASSWWSKFDLSTDHFLQAWGLTAQQAQQAQQQGLESPNDMTFTTWAGDGPLITLATTDTGAIVAGTVVQTVEVRPGEEGAKVIAQGDKLAFSDVERSERGYTSTYVGQLLYLIPPLDSDAPITVLGYAQGIVDASELP